MNKKILKNLVLKSITRNSLDDKKVEMIAGILSRKELKTYITALKNWEMRKKVVIISSVPLKMDTEKQFKKIFKDKDIINEIDPSLVVGVRIINNDLVYDLCLESALDDLIITNQAGLL